jgi:hypothetical protein
MNTIIGIVEQGLILLNKLVPDEATKIANKVLEYRRAWDEEMAKGSLRDDARLDMLDRELRDIGELFSAALKGAASKIGN